MKMKINGKLRKVTIGSFIYGVIIVGIGEHKMLFQRYQYNHLLNKDGSLGIRAIKKLAAEALSRVK
jgi:hypothetical protein